VDCVATPEILETIFFPNNAIHDGGVIIKATELLSRCIFPLTRRQDLNKTLGTRHRAAIGLSEETDASSWWFRRKRARFRMRIGRVGQGNHFGGTALVLSSMLVQPHKSRNIADWLKTLQGHHVKPGPAVVTKSALTFSSPPMGTGERHDNVRARTYPAQFLAEGVFVCAGGDDLGGDSLEFCSTREQPERKTRFGPEHGVFCAAVDVKTCPMISTYARPAVT